MSRKVRWVGVATWPMVPNGCGLWWNWTPNDIISHHPSATRPAKLFIRNPYKFGGEQAVGLKLIHRKGGRPWRADWQTDGSYLRIFSLDVLLSKGAELLQLFYISLAMFKKTSCDCAKNSVLQISSFYDVPLTPVCPPYSNFGLSINDT